MNENQKRPQNGGHSSRRSLLGKVVLLIGDDMALLRALVPPLAAKGADIALIGAEQEPDELGSMRDSVESAGRHLMLIDVEQQQEESPQALIQSVTAGLGRLDIFIDLTGAGGSEPQLLPNWGMAQAALGAMARL